MHLCVQCSNCNSSRRVTSIPSPFAVRAILVRRFVSPPARENFYIVTAELFAPSKFCRFSSRGMNAVIGKAQETDCEKEAGSRSRDME